MIHAAASPHTLQPTPRSREDLASTSSRGADRPIHERGAGVQSPGAADRVQGVISEISPDAVAASRRAAEIGQQENSEAAGLVVGRAELGQSEFELDTKDDSSVKDTSGKGEASRAEAAEKKEQPGELSEEERAQVKELAARDREVRAHEQAHLAAAGGLAKGGPTYSFQTGPDGRRYAVGGEVQIKTGGGNTPEQRLAQAEQASRAANAPAEPSGADRAVAAAAAAAAAEARAEISARALETSSERIGESASSEEGVAAPAAESESGKAAGELPSLLPATDQNTSQPGAVQPGLAAGGPSRNEGRSEGRRNIVGAESPSRERVADEQRTAAFAAATRSYSLVAGGAEDSREPSSPLS